MLLLLTMVIVHVNGASSQPKSEASEAARLEQIQKRLLDAAMRFPSLTQEIKEHKDGRPLTPDRDLKANDNYVLTKAHREKFSTLRFSSLRITTSPVTSPDTSPDSSPCMLSDSSSTSSASSSPEKIEKTEQPKK